MRVLKFCGTSVADAVALGRVVAIVGGWSGAGTVVVSALAGATDALQAIADTASRDHGAALASLEVLAARHRGIAATLRGEYAGRVVDPALEGIARGAAGAVQAIAESGIT